MKISSAVWTWFNDSRSIYLNENKLLIGYVNGDAQPGLSVYDVNTQEVVNINLGTSLSTQRDDHNNPALTLLSDGNVLVVYSRHGSDKAFFYRVSRNANPLTIEDWSEEKSVDRGATTSYANLVRLKYQKGCILNFHRCINWNPTLSIYDETNDRWAEPLPFIKTGAGKVRPYFKLASDGVARTHFIYTDHHPNNFNNSVYHLYFEDGQFFNSQGIFLKALEDGPLEHDAGQTGSLLYEFKEDQYGAHDSAHDWIPGGCAWVWDIALNHDGQTVCVFSVCRRNQKKDSWLGDRIFYYWAILTSDGWKKRCIASAGRPLCDTERDYAAGICLDKSNPYKVYLCSNANSPFDVSMSVDDVGEAELRTTYDMFEVILTQDLNVSSQLLCAGNAYRPYSVISENGRSALLWLSGSYESYRTFETDLNIKIID